MGAPRKQNESKCRARWKRSVPKEQEQKRRSIASNRAPQMRLPMRSDEVHEHYPMTGEGNQTAGNNGQDPKTEFPDKIFADRQMTANLEKLSERPAAETEPIAGFPFTLELVGLLNG